ncbi:DEKNAAC100409 [Brettanomyces naardenensis]|uniref:DEKNAAC100409 n=1 Tax=Brettanomyces naardenensis TaxID=13370 RepID=A0A448YG33_BRENA|nr:DEKNAAC100409 [Brettanomyces naardenensis]
MSRRKLVVIATALIVTILTIGLILDRERVTISSGAVQSRRKNTRLKSHSPDGRRKKPVATEDRLLEACTVINPLTNQFYDLRSLASVEKELNGQTVRQVQPWMSRGFDYGGNFTIGICSSPLVHLDEMDFPNVVNRTDVGAFFSSPDAKGRISLGQVSRAPKFRGRKLIMEYTGGDLCPNSDDRRRSTLLMFTCDREMASKAKVSYIGSLDDCSYFFEVKTIHACATAPTNESMGIVSIVILIGSAAAITFFGGGLLYGLFKTLGLGQPSPKLQS